MMSELHRVSIIQHIKCTEGAPSTVMRPPGRLSWLFKGGIRLDSECDVIITRTALRKPVRARHPASDRCGVLFCVRMAPFALKYTLTFINEGVSVCGCKYYTSPEAGFYTCLIV
ncbi:hypothetical protein SAMN04488523_12120 [Sulfitobacter brevis]|uniref:Uncharacterized protein n=1 Tax=Sulfitobacter brevis TaxID=74348 RepID=A0A1I2GBZ5_9RHOB|nr:hypothetical protein SAMN04488523_12120 [Sulfitobacter brevis]